MPRDVLLFLDDIVKACDRITAFVIGKTPDDYRDDVLLRSAVERQFTIIGEALNQAMRLDPTIADGISRVQQIVDFRNVLIHGYSAVRYDVVWGIIAEDLPVLRVEVERTFRTSTAARERSPI